MKGIFYDCDVIISCIGGRRSCSTLPTRTTLYSEATKVLLCSLVESESRKQAAALNQMRGDETSRTETNKESAEGVSQSESSGSMRQPLHLIYASTWGTKCNIIDFSFFFPWGLQNLSSRHTRHSGTRISPPLKACLDTTQIFVTLNKIVQELPFLPNCNKAEWSTLLYTFPKNALWSSKNQK